MRVLSMETAIKESVLVEARAAVAAGRPHQVVVGGDPVTGSPAIYRLAIS